MTYDVCIIGHVTRDRIEIAGAAPRCQPGGTAYYAGVTARRLGLRTVVITKMSRTDRELLADLEALGIDVRCLPSAATTTFVNTYTDPDTRHQRVEAVADPFCPGDLDVAAPLYLLGPLTRNELPAACVDHLARRDARLALDVQGLLRDVRDGRVVLAPNEALTPLLARVDILKADEDEARRITGAASAAASARLLGAAGPAEVVVTSGSRGSHLFLDGRLIAIPAYPPPCTVDTTGCGDTYFAAYLARRLAGDDAARAGRFAAAVASAKIAHHGPFCGTAADARVLQDTRLMLV